MQPRRRIRVWLALLTWGLMLPGSVVAVDDRATELAAIETTLGDYLQGGKNGDLARLRGAFHSSARLQFVVSGTYTEWSLDQYIAARTPGHKSGHATRILSIDFAGSAASAKVELDFGRQKLVDYMSLLKIGNRWWIVNRIFYRIND